METRIEKMNLETLGAVEREREREYLANNYVDCLLKQTCFSDAQNQENGINLVEIVRKARFLSLAFLCYLFSHGWKIIRI